MRQAGRCKNFPYFIRQEDSFNHLNHSDCSNNFNVSDSLFLSYLQFVIHGDNGSSNYNLLIQCICFKIKSS